MYNADKNVKALPKYVDVSESEEYEVVSNQGCTSNDGDSDVTGLLFRKRFPTSDQYEKEWRELYEQTELDFDILRRKSVNGELNNSYFRSICWRCLLGILHKQPLQWPCELETYRKHYDEVCAELEHNPRNGAGGDIQYDNPLSQESDSIWQKYFCDEELKAVILQDVKRTFPDIDYFRDEKIQKIMVRILFCYARQNPVLCYRQGMHEILAPLILVLHCDHQVFLHSQRENSEIGKDISVVLCPDYLEHDAYSLFKNVMSHIQCSYRVNVKDGYKTSQNEVIERLEHIKKKLFREKDPELSDHLDKLDIPLHLFGIRWLRLLFGREFPLQDLLILWDFLFANNLDCINYMVVAMLVAIRQLLLDGDYNTCLCTLMKYPNGVNVNWIIAYVLHMKDPARHPVPDFEVIKSAGQGTEQRKFPQPQRRSKKGVRRPSKRYDSKHRLQVERGPGGDVVIVPGLVPNDSKMADSELQHLKMILGIVHHKLLHFHAVLRRNLPEGVGSDVELVVDGIYELSRFLKSYEACGVEAACEAGETKDPTSPTTTTTVPERTVRGDRVKKSNLTRGTASHTLPKMKRHGPSRSGELAVFKHEIGGALTGAPMTDPLHLIKKSSEDDLSQ